jgi:hypothetical protein
VLFPDDACREARRARRLLLQLLDKKSENWETLKSSKTERHPTSDFSSAAPNRFPDGDEFVRNLHQVLLGNAPLLLDFDSKSSRKFPLHRGELPGVC